MPLSPGLHGSAKLIVSDDDTAIALKSGDVAVLGTPRLIALVEEAALGAVADSLPTGQTTVGMRVQIDHLAPTNVGSTVAAEATLEKVEGRRLTFTVSDAGLVEVSLNGSPATEGVSGSPHTYRFRLGDGGQSSSNG